MSSAGAKREQITPSANHGLLPSQIQGAFPIPAHDHLQSGLPSCPFTCIATSSQKPFSIWVTIIPMVLSVAHMLAQLHFGGWYSSRPVPTKCEGQMHLYTWVTGVNPSLKHHLHPIHLPSTPHTILPSSSDLPSVIFYLLNVALTAWGLIGRWAENS